jgi:hypothetical protein
VVAIADMESRSLYFPHVIIIDIATVFSIFSLYQDILPLLFCADDDFDY